MWFALWIPDHEMAIVMVKTFGDDNSLLTKELQLKFYEKAQNSSFNLFVIAGREDGACLPAGRKQSRFCRERDCHVALMGSSQ